MISFHPPSLALLGRIVSLILTVWFYLLFVLMTARYSRSTMKFLLQMFLQSLQCFLLGGLDLFQPFCCGYFIFFFLYQLEKKSWN